MRLFSLLGVSAFVAACPTVDTPEAKPLEPVELPGVGVPTLFVEDRFFLETSGENGESLKIFTDTGGGLFISSAAVTRLELQTQPRDVDGQQLDCALVPALAPGGDLPPFQAFEGWLPIVDERELSFTDESEAMLGQGWFRERIWMFDYEGGQLRLLDEDDVPTGDEAHAEPLGFPTSVAGVRQTNYPRIQATLDGEIVDLLFDTGATVHMTSSARTAIDDGQGASRATSFIIATKFDAWRERHPDWRVIENADALVAGESMIEVPAIDVAGVTVGPVWFTRRADSNFHDFMSQFMDRRIDGALGGSALAHFRVTVDYPNAVAIFEPR